MEQAQQGSTPTTTVSDRTGGEEELARGPGALTGSGSRSVQSRRLPPRHPPRRPFSSTPLLSFLKASERAALFLSLRFGFPSLPLHTSLSSRPSVSLPPPLPPCAPLFMREEGPWGPPPPPAPAPPSARLSLSLVVLLLLAGPSSCWCCQGREGGAEVARMGLAGDGSADTAQHLRLIFPSPLAPPPAFAFAPHLSGWLRRGQREPTLPFSGGYGASVGAEIRGQRGRVILLYHPLPGLSDDAVAVDFGTPDSSATGPASHLDLPNCYCNLPYLCSLVWSCWLRYEGPTMAGYLLALGSDRSGPFFCLFS